MRTKAELVSEINERTGVKLGQIELVLETLGDLVDLTLAKGGEFKLPGVGVLSVRQAAPRRGRSPTTGEIFNVPGRRVVTFKPVSALKERVR